MLSRIRHLFRPESDGTRIEEAEETEPLSELSPSYVYQVAILLSRLTIPKDVIPLILEFGEFYAIHTATCNNVEVMIRENRSGLIHSAAALPTNINPRSLRAVIFDIKSRDQGWSWDTANHGTYNGSWTWFEAGILSEATLSEFTAQTYARGENHYYYDEDQLREERKERANPDDMKRIVTNVHADRDYMRHRVKWTSNDPDPWIQGVFARLASGATVGIEVHALYPAWCNDVACTGISFEFLPVRKVP